MIEWNPILWLAAQAACTIITVEQLRRRVFAGMHAFDHPQIVHDVWAPITVIVPLLFFAWRVEGSVAGVGWMAVGAPAVCAVFALAGALVLSESRGLSADIPVPHLLIWTGAGLLLLLLGAAHDLTLWFGQCAFAVAAILLWVNTPDEPVPAFDEQTTQQVRAGFGMTIALLAAVGQGVCAIFVPPQATAVSGAMVIAGAAMAVVAAARVAGPITAIRLGGWTAVYGILIGLGMISLFHLVPELFHRIVRDGQSRSIHRIAFGFGAYWIEALILIGFAAAALFLTRLAIPVRRLIGTILLIGGAILAAWRLSGF